MRVAAAATGTGDDPERYLPRSTKRDDNLNAILAQHLRQRFRDVKQGPDGRLWILTDEDDGLVLRIEPVGG